jgi:hypothetical protein
MIHRNINKCCERGFDPNPGKILPGAMLLTQLTVVLVLFIMNGKALESICPPGPKVSESVLTGRANHKYY